MISAAIMAHPSREHFVAELAEQLPEAEIVWDRHNDRWETGARSLRAFDPAAEHHLVLQDDGVPCADLLTAAERAAKAAGERPVALYTGRVRPHQRTINPAVRQARTEGRPWIAAPGPYWGVGLVIPTAHIEELTWWGDNHAEISNYDRRIAAWYAEQEIDCWYTVPSLVNHRPVAENPSLVKGRTGNRTAHWFINGGDPLAIDWSGEPVPVRRK